VWSARRRRGDGRRTERMRAIRTKPGRAAVCEPARALTRSTLCRSFSCTGNGAKCQSYTPVANGMCAGWCAGNIKPRYARAVDPKAKCEVDVELCANGSVVTGGRCARHAEIVEHRKANNAQFAAARSRVCGSGVTEIQTAYSIQLASTCTIEGAEMRRATDCLCRPRRGPAVRPG